MTKELNTYKIKWAVKGTLEDFSEYKIQASSEDIARKAFEETTMRGITKILSIELIDDSGSPGVREPNKPPLLPHPPLTAMKDIPHEED
jgi:hypothetical protein